MKTFLMLLLTVLIAAMFASTASAKLGNLQFHCPPMRDPANTSQFIFKQQDPVIAYGVAVSDHLHQAQRPFSSTTTYADLLAGQTGCIAKVDRSLFLWPVPMAPAGTPVPVGGAVQPDGRVAIGANNFRYYYRSISSTGQVLQFPSAGFSQVVGNHNNTNDYGSPARWQCLYGPLGNSPPLLWMPNENTTGTYNGKAWNCASPAILEVTARDANTCWNGTQNGPGMGAGGAPQDGRSHKEPCDAAHPYRLPVIDNVLDFPHAALTVGTRLSSDHTGVRAGLSFHYDNVVKFGPDPVTGEQDVQTRISNLCMNSLESPIDPGLPMNYPAMDPNGLTCQEVDGPADGQPVGTGTIWVTTRPPIPLGQQGPNKNIQAVAH